MRPLVSLVLAATLASTGCATTGTNRSSGPGVGTGVAIGVVISAVAVVGLPALAISRIPEPTPFEVDWSCETGCD